MASMPIPLSRLHPNAAPTPYHAQSAPEAARRTDHFDARTAATAPDPTWGPNMHPAFDFMATPTVLHPNDPRAAGTATALGGAYAGPTIGAGLAADPPFSGQPWGGHVGQLGPQQQGVSPHVQAAPSSSTRRSPGCWSAMGPCGRAVVVGAIIVAVVAGSVIGGIVANRGSGNDKRPSPGPSGTSAASSTATFASTGTATDASASSTASAPPSLLAADTYPVSLPRTFDNCTDLDVFCGASPFVSKWTFTQDARGRYTYTGPAGYSAPAKPRTDAQKRTALVFPVAPDGYAYMHGGCKATYTYTGTVVPTSQKSFEAHAERLFTLCGERAGNTCTCRWDGES